MLSFGKRFGTWALCICLLCMLPVMTLAASVEDCPGNCNHQAAIGTTHYDTIADAFAAAVDESTVTLLADVSDATPMTIDKSITLDLGGKTITGQTTAEESLITATKDITVTNGTLTTKSGVVLLATDSTVTIEETATIQGGDEAVAIRVESVEAKAGASISGQVASTAEKAAAIDMVSSGDYGCELSIKKPAVINAEGDAVKMRGSGKLEITGGTIIAKENAIVLDIADNKTIEASVTGGSFTAKNGEIFVITTGTNATAPKDFVTGGTFNKIPSDYIPGSHDTQENGDGSHTIISSYLVTFHAGGAYGTMDAMTVPCGESITLPQCGFTPGDNMEFAGWEIGGNTYAVGATFTPVSDTVITALWDVHEHYGGYATCVSPAICSDCGSAYGQYGSHDLTSGGYAATCDSTGMLPHTQCVHCGICFVDGVEVSSFSLSTPALGHQWKNEKAKAATCTEAGIQEYRHCTTCGAIQVGGKDVEASAVEIPALGHTMKVINAVPSTCSQAGVQAHSHCTTCGKYFLQNKEVDPAQLTTALASHVLRNDWHSDEIYHWKTCVDCDAVFRQDKHVDSNADNICDDCGYAIPVISQPTEAEAEESGSFSFLYLIPVFVAAAIAVITAVSVAVQKYNRRKRRKMRQMRKMQK